MFLREVEYVVRKLSKSLGFSLVVVAVLGLGVGSALILFSFTWGILLRPLPYPEPDRLIWIQQQNPERGIEEERSSAGDYGDWATMAESFDSLVALQASGQTAQLGEQAFQVKVGKVTAGFFPLLGATPELGRSFRPDEEEPGQDDVVVLGHGFWRRHFGADKGALEKTFILDGRPHMVIGVMPPSFRFDGLRGVEIWRPASFSSELKNDRSGTYLDVIGRLAPGVGLEAARQELDLVSQRRQELYGEKKEWVAEVVPLRSALTGEVSAPIKVFFGASFFVLLIICVNLANLFLARFEGNRFELATRLAMGAKRGDLVRQLTLESAVLGILGGAAGIVLSYWGLPLLIASVPSDIPRLDEVRIDVQVLAGAVGLTILATLLFGLLPAFKASRMDPWRSLQQSGGRRASGGRKARRFQMALVVLQLSIAVPLLMASVLMFRSFLSMRSLDPGFETENLYVASVRLPSAAYPDGARRWILYEELVERVGQGPSIEKAAISTSTPFGGEVLDLPVQVRGPEGELQADIASELVSPGFFETLGIGILAGRSLGSQDRSEGTRVAVISNALARRFWPGENAVGRVMNVAGSEYQVVGIAEDLLDPGLGSDIVPKLYLPYAQLGGPDAVLMVRSRDSLAVMAPWVRSQMGELDARIQPADIRPVSDFLGAVQAPNALFMRMMGFFSLIATLVAALGLYGLLAYGVRQRRGEIGIRMAMGARRGDVLRMILGESVSITAIALVFGAGLALVTSQLLTSLLFGVPAADLGVLVGVVFLLVATALLAAFFPARRASSVNPSVVLSSD